MLISPTYYFFKAINPNQTHPSQAIVFKLIFLYKISLLGQKTRVIQNQAKSMLEQGLNVVLGYAGKSCLDTFFKTYLLYHK